MDGVVEFLVGDFDRVAAATRITVNQMLHLNKIIVAVKVDILEIDFSLFQESNYVFMNGILQTNWQNPYP